MFFRSIGTLPTACTASVWNSAPASCAISASCSTGKIVPVSLFAHMIEAMAVFGPQRLAVGVDVQPAAASTRRCSDLDAARAFRSQSHSARIAGCSTAEVMISLRPAWVSSADRIAVLSDSVPLRGVDDLVVEFARRAAPGIGARACLQGGADFGAERVHRGRVAELLGEERQHRLDDFGIDAGGGVVVEINRAHGVASSAQ